MADRPSSRKTKAQLLAELADLQARLEALEETVRTNQVLLDESSDPIFSFYPDGTYRYVNRAFADGVGRPVEEIQGHKIWDVFSQDEADKRYAVVKWVYANAQTRVIEVRVPRPDGDHFYITTAKPILNDRGEVVSVICISKEITERKRMEEELRRLSRVDTLSGLYNRNHLEDCLVQIQQNGPFPVSVVMVDLNNLKSTNDRHGHAAGDQMIRATAAALRASFRADDVIARLGGDEFVVLLPGADETAAAACLERFRAVASACSDPQLDLSAGTATGAAGDTLADLLRLADARMYQEKLARRGSPAK